MTPHTDMPRVAAAAMANVLEEAAVPAVLLVGWIALYVGWVLSGVPLGSGSTVAP